MKAFCLVARGLKAFVLAVVTPLLEKNPAKTIALGTSVVFSMARLIVLAFAIAMLRQIALEPRELRGFKEATGLTRLMRVEGHEVITLVVEPVVVRRLRRRRIRAQGAVEGNAVVVIPEDVMDRAREARQNPREQPVGRHVLIRGQDAITVQQIGTGEIAAEDREGRRRIKNPDGIDDTPE